MSKLFVMIDPKTSTEEHRTDCPVEATGYILDPFFSNIPLIVETWIDNKLISTDLYNCDKKNLS